MSDLDASQFYTGLVAELYEPLVSELARADQYIPFIERSGQPSLELGCGSGIPMLELIQRGYEVEGLDASAAMLARCRDKAEKLGLKVILHHQQMQRLDLPRLYPAIFLAGATFTLLTSDADARETIQGIYRHLEPGGSVLIPLRIPEVESIRKQIGRFRETRVDDGPLLRVGVVDAEFDTERRHSRIRLRYERVQADGTIDWLERDWLGSWWTQAMFRQMLLESGFATITILDPDGGKADPEASVFVFLAQKGGGSET